jgi:nickel-dependent lactate racemase
MHFKTPLLARWEPEGRFVTAEEVAQEAAAACPAADYRGKKVLLIVPDGTRTAPIGMLFKALFAQLGEVTGALDLMIALGTHQPMSEAAICARLEISEAERRDKYKKVRFYNHAWDDPAALREIGVIGAEEIGKLTNGLFAMDVPVEINRRVFEYDQVIIVGPVFPHEVVGFSGGNKY